MIGRLLIALGVLLLAAGPAAAERTVAVTFDDIPMAQTGSDPCDADRVRAFTTGFVAMLKAQKVPAVAFANPGRTCEAIRGVVPGVLDIWAAAGFELGNHTYGHPNVHRVGLAAYEQDVVAAEPALKAAAARRGLPFRFFRHPYLFRGDTSETREALQAFLAGRGYTEAPVTLDNGEWVYAFLYSRAKAAGDTALMARLGEDYVRHMEAVTAFFEPYSVQVLGREPAQVLLVHANELNLDYFPKVRAMLAVRGYRFVTLETALKDPAYARPDTFAARNGLSWLHRWNVTAGGKLVQEPQPSAWVMEMYEGRSGAN